MPELVVRRETRRVRYFREKLGEQVALDMVLVTGGTFMMGSPEDEPERLDREGPQHQVTVPPFAMGRYPVTQAQYEAVMDANPATKYDADRFVAPNKPVVGVTWHEAVEFCDRLAARTGRAYRLPSEAEWEYACRAGTQTPFHFGKTLTTELANYNGNYTYNDGPKGVHRYATTPVGEFPANAWGLHDMHGNVFEWCADRWQEDYEGAPTDGSARTKVDKGRERHVFRGGSWLDAPRRCRSAYRNNVIGPGNRINSSIGFRVVCSAPRT